MNLVSIDTSGIASLEELHDGLVSCGKQLKMESVKHLFFKCGYLGQIKLPFTTIDQPHCGLLAIHDCEQHYQHAPRTVQLSNSTSKQYTVLQIEPRTIIITDDEQDHYLRNKSCKTFSNNFTLHHNTPLASFYIKYNITIFRCNHSLRGSLHEGFNKYSNCSHQYHIYYGYPNTETPLDSKWPRSLAPCSTIQLATQATSTVDPFQFLSGNIAIEVQLTDDCERCLLDGKPQCSLDTEGKLNCAKVLAKETHLHVVQKRAERVKGTKQQVTLKLMVSKERNEVFLIKAAKDFGEVMFSFLTFPLGNIAIQMEKEPIEVGSLSSLYQSVANIE
ncbi:hypothetical protein HKD37_05G012432 [Glycine soja]